MALHRDIFWIGRQWAVTGHGMQLIDQRLKGAFDIEVARLWDDDLIERMHAKEWLNAADFDKGLEVARTRHAKPGPASLTAPAPAIEPIALLPLVAKPEAPEFEMRESERSVPLAVPPAAAPQVPASPPPVPIEPPKQESSDIEMKIDGHARFVRPWRVWMKRKT